MSIGGKKMVERNDLEITVRNMVAFDILSKPLSSLGHKADRRRDKLAEIAAGLLGSGYETERVVAYVEKREEEKARTLREGIEAFKEEHPRYGKILEGMIVEKRAASSKYLVFNVAEGYRLAAEDYRRVMRELGMSTIQADAMYPHLLEISDKLGKAGENAKRSILL